MERQGVHATFFFTGGWIEKFPEDVKTILSKGHEIGNHSENHKQMSQLSKEQCKEELQKVHDKVKALTGIEMSLFRPPFGDYDDTVIEAANELGYHVIQWDVEGLDIVFDDPGKSSKTLAIFWTFAYNLLNILSTYVVCGREFPVELVRNGSAI